MAGKYKKGLVNEVKADIAYEKEQEKLKEKYNLDEDVVVVEKSNAYKFTVTVLINVIKNTGNHYHFDFSSHWIDYINLSNYKRSRSAGLIFHKRPGSNVFKIEGEIC